MRAKSKEPCTRCGTGEQRAKTKDKGIIPVSDGEHGGNLHKIAEETGIPENRLVDFSASINPMGISQRVKDAINDEMGNLVNYPDPDTTLLKKKLAEFHHIDPETILCGNGSTELIYLIPRALKPGKVLIPAPSFSEYERACKLSYESSSKSQELRVMSYELRKESGFNLIIKDYIAAMKGCDMAFLCNPNNPTGTLITRQDVLRIAGAAKSEKCMLVVDEAFIDFSPGESVIGDVRENPYLIVLRSMTKFHALTGLRIGYGIMNESVIGKLKEYKEPWTVNNLAQKAAVTAIDDAGYVAETMKLMSNEKEYMEKSFRQAGIKYLLSPANYYLLEIENAGSIINGLKNKGLIVRDCSNFKGLDGPYIRVAVKSHEDNKLLIKEISKLCRV
jgi:threonine-phosphate decarboxylase